MNHCLWDNIKQSKLYVFGIPKRRKGEKKIQTAVAISNHWREPKISEWLLVAMTCAGPSPDMECPTWMTLLSLGTSRHQTWEFLRTITSA